MQYKSKTYYIPSILWHGCAVPKSIDLHEIWTEVVKLDLSHEELVLLLNLFCRPTEIVSILSTYNTQITAMLAHTSDAICALLVKLISSLRRIDTSIVLLSNIVGICNHRECLSLVLHYLSMKPLSLDCNLVDYTNAHDIYVEFVCIDAPVRIYRNCPMVTFSTMIADMKAENLDTDTIVCPFDADTVSRCQEIFVCNRYDSKCNLLLKWLNLKSGAYRSLLSSIGLPSGVDIDLIHEPLNVIDIVTKRGARNVHVNGGIILDTNDITIHSRTVDIVVVDKVPIYVTYNGEFYYPLSVIHGRYQPIPK